MFRSASLFIGTSFTVAVFTIFATSNVDSIVGIPHKIYSMQRILIHIKSRSLCYMCPSAPRACSEPGGQKLELSLSLDLIHRPVTRSIDVFFDLRPNKRPSKQWWGWWFETLSNPLWRHYNAPDIFPKHKFPMSLRHGVRWSLGMDK